MLRDEHRRILQVVDAMTGHLDLGRRSTSPGILGNCVEFFRLYTDALHHGKEEDLLFESLAERGFSRHSGPISVMLHEHQIGRALVRQMADLMERLDDDPEAWREFDHAARSYAGLIHRHIEREDHGLFGMADHAIEEPECRRLCDAYDTVCARRFEGRTLEELERLAEEIIAGET
jgi:hemerythrin-like domain-containing protein